MDRQMEHETGSRVLEGFASGELNGSAQRIGIRASELCSAAAAVLASSVYMLAGQPDRQTLKIQQIPELPLIWLPNQIIGSGHSKSGLNLTAELKLKVAI